MRSLKSKYVVNSKANTKEDKVVKKEEPLQKKVVQESKVKVQEPKQDKDRVSISYMTFVQLNTQKRGHKVRIVDYKKFNEVVCLEVDTKQKIVKDMNSLVEYLKQGIMYFTNPSILQNFGIWSK